MLGDSIRASIYDLNKGTIGIIKDLKNTKTPVKLSNDGSMLAVLHLSDSTDHVSLINMSNHKLLCSFDTKLRNCNSIEWSSDDDIIMIKEKLFDCSVAFYMLNGTLIHKYDRKTVNDGFDKVFVSKSFKNCCFVGFSEKIYLSEFMKFSVLKTLDLGDLLISSKSITFYKEISNGKKFPEKNRESRFISNKSEYSSKLGSEGCSTA